MTSSGSSIAPAEPSDEEFRYLGELDRAHLARDPLEVAPDLIGTILVSKDAAAGVTAGRIVEVEAYRGAEDPASHAFRGMTARNRTMFERAGLLYVYFSYGMHYCCNVVCAEEGEAGAVLIRALEPLVGGEEMTRRRAVRRGTALSDLELCSGPGKLCQALAISRADDGADLLSQASRVRLATTSPPARRGRLATSPRVGIAQHLATASESWRFYDADSPHVSTRGRPRRPHAPPERKTSA